MARDSSTSLAPGFRFHPTDEELVRFYLKRKVIGKPFRVDPIALVDVYKFEPWDLPCKSKLKTRDLEWYFFSVLDRKYGNGSRTNRATEKGYWKTTGKDRAIKHGERTVGMKKTLVYHIGRAPRGDRTNWVMHEYKLVDEELAQAGVVQDAFVLCRIFEKSGAGPKNGEKYGAPFIEEEWEDDDVVAALPVGDYQLLNEVSPGDAGGFIETDDLYQKLDKIDKIGSADPPSNFYEGECSSYPEHSQQSIDYQKPLAGTDGISGPQNDQPFDIADSEKYDVYTSSVKDEDNGNMSHNENHTIDRSFDDLDLYFDSTGYLPFDYLPIDGDASFLETNDLVNPVEGNPTDADPSGTDMLDEYLAYPDDDITKYISFDFPHEAESENPISNQGPPPIQQIVDGETEDTSLAETEDASRAETKNTKHDIEAPSSNKAASSDQNIHPHPSNAVSGNTNSFVKQTNKWLDSIPAAPAFASEFPTKEMAIGLHHAAQSSNSAHVTAGMISITNITLRGNAVDWMVGKNGGINAVVSARFSQPDVNSAALLPYSGMLSGKTTFVLSHGWIYLLIFSVLILSLSFKIGTSMYTSK